MISIMHGQEKKKKKRRRRGRERESGCHHQRKKTPVTTASRVFYFSVPGEEKGKRDEIHWN